MKTVNVENGVYYAELSKSVLMDLINYFIDMGIHVSYEIIGGSGLKRTIKFRQDDAGADLLLAWIVCWEDGHKYCPFCGGLPEVYTRKAQTLDFLGIRCSKCGIMTDDYLDEEMAWWKWDKRV
jgi:hypothetical protein